MQPIPFTTHPQPFLNQHSSSSFPSPTMPMPMYTEPAFPSGFYPGFNPLHLLWWNQQEFAMNAMMNAALSIPYMMGSNMMTPMPNMMAMPLPNTTVSILPQTIMSIDTPPGGFQTAPTPERSIVNTVQEDKIIVGGKTFEFVPFSPPDSAQLKKPEENESKKLQPSSIASFSGVIQNSTQDLKIEAQVELSEDILLADWLPETDTTTPSLHQDLTPLNRSGEISSSKRKFTIKNVTDQKGWSIRSRILRLKQSSLTFYFGVQDNNFEKLSLKIFTCALEGTKLTDISASTAKIVQTTKKVENDGWNLKLYFHDKENFLSTKTRRLYTFSFGPYTIFSNCLIVDNVEANNRQKMFIQGNQALMSKVFWYKPKKAKPTKALDPSGELKKRKLEDIMESFVYSEDNEYSPKNKKTKTNAND